MTDLHELDELPIVEQLETMVEAAERVGIVEVQIYGAAGAAGDCPCLSYCGPVRVAHEHRETLDLPFAFADLRGLLWIDPPDVTAVRWEGVGPKSLLIEMRNGWTVVFGLARQPTP
jgi:hypothetical protein